jgi:uncharacterized membrane protein
MMMTEMDIETSVYNVHLMRLIAREDFIKLLLLVHSIVQKTFAVLISCVMFSLSVAFSFGWSSVSSNNDQHD